MAVKTIEDYIADFSRVGMAVAGLGQLRSGPFGGVPRKWYCSVYPSAFGYQVWVQVDAKSNGWSVGTPTFTGHGDTPEEAMAEAYKTARFNPKFKLYRRLSQAFQEWFDAIEAGNSGRDEDGQQGEGDGLDGL